MTRISIVRIVALLAVALVAVSSAAIAGPGKETKLSGAFSFFGGNTPVLGGYNTAQDLVGVRYQFHAPFGQSHHWNFAPGLSYGYGHNKDEFTGTLNSSSETTASMWDAMLDFLYYNDCCDDDDFYCGPGLFYSSTKLKDKQTGYPDITSDPYNTFGVQLTVGGGIPFNQKLELTGSMTERFGMSMYDHKASGTEDKLSGITYSTQLGLGLRMSY